MQGGVPTTLVPITLEYNQDAWNDYTLSIVDNNISCYLNGQLAASYIDDTWEDGKVGIFNQWHQNARYDNYTVSSWDRTNEGSFIIYGAKLLENIVMFDNVGWSYDSVNEDNNVSKLYTGSQADMIVDAALEAGDAIDAALSATTKQDTVYYWQKVFGSVFQV